jgi:predicted outer membrane protein
VTFAATGQESTSKLTNDQITRLFNKLKWLADPGNFEKAYADANPEIALEENKRQRAIFRIQKTAEKKGFNETWLETAVEHKCAKHRVSCWRKLPLAELINFSKTVESRKGRAAPVQDGCTGVVDPDDIVF